MQFLDRTVRPALDEVAAEFQRQGYEVARDIQAAASNNEDPLLRVAMADVPDFYYQVAIVQVPVPKFSGKASRGNETYCRLEVLTQSGSGGYDLMGLTRQQVIDDVLEQYEAHLSALTAALDV